MLVRWQNRKYGALFQSRILISPTKVCRKMLWLSLLIRWTTAWQTLACMYCVLRTCNNVHKCFQQNVDCQKRNMAGVLRHVNDYFSANNFKNKKIGLLFGFVDLKIQNEWITSYSLLRKGPLFWSKEKSI